MSSPSSVSEVFLLFARSQNHGRNRHLLPAQSITVHSFVEVVDCLKHSLNDFKFLLLVNESKWMPKERCSKTTGNRNEYRKGLSCTTISLFLFLKTSGKRQNRNSPKQRNGIKKNTKSKINTRAGKTCQIKWFFFFSSGKKNKNRKTEKEGRIFW